MRRLLLLVLSSLVAACGPDPSPPPNILFIAVDDLRPEFAAYGREGIHTPTLDRLAAAGVVFRRAYCNVPVCGASRASLLTGLRPTRDRFRTYLTRADEDAPGKEAVFPRWHGAESIQTDQYLYTEWLDDDGSVRARMLYDHETDPDETVNLAEQPAYAEIVADLHERLYTLMAAR